MKILDRLKKSRRKIKPYSLSLSDVITKDGDLFCIFSQQNEINSIKTPLKSIFQNEKIIKHIHPSELLLLHQIYLDSIKQQSRIKLKSIIKGNKYELLLDNDLEMTVSGEDLYKDMTLLESMGIKDIFKIIYNTAYKEAYSNFHKSQTRKTKKQAEKTNDVTLTIVK